MTVASGSGSRSRILDRIGLLAALALAAGPALAWARLLPALAGFALYAVGGVVSVAMGLSALVASARGRSFGAGRSLALLAAMIFLLTATAGGGRSPRINDYTTDLDDPPAFREALSDPANAGRNLTYPAPFAEVQRSCCADVRPARLGTRPEEAFARARSVAERMPSWEITAVDAANGRIEAVATTRIFGFRDDVAIRVRPDGQGSRIDVRSKSRDGQGDLGANAERIRIFVRAVEAQG